jgi:hypothetical protein
MRQEVRQIAVVREEDEPFARPVETPHGEEAAIARHEIDHTRSSRRIVVRGHHADRLVEEVDDSPRIRKPLAVNANLLGSGIDLRAERGHDLAVHLDAS